MNSFFLFILQRQNLANKQKIEQGQTVHRTEVTDISDKQKNVLKIRCTNLKTEKRGRQENNMKICSRFTNLSYFKKQIFCN